MREEENEQIVYWAPWIDRETGQRDNKSTVSEWLYKEPSSVWQELLEIKDQNIISSKVTTTYLQCPATREALSSVFVVRCPCYSSAEVLIREDNQIEKVEQAWTGASQCEITMSHAPTLYNQLLVIVNYPFIFFSEESLFMRSTSPWFHSAPHTSLGGIVPGLYDIGRWFRPLNFEYNLWYKNNRFELGEGEPMAYLEFSTSKPVVFKRFELTQTLINLATDSIHTRTKQTRGLNGLWNRYKMFDESYAKKIITKEIKAHLL